MRSVLLGGGVAGCALAAALRGSRLGDDPLVVERRLATTPAGMGFLLLENGIRALEQIAPEVEWRRTGQSIERLRLRAADGADIDAPRIEPALCVSRTKFLALLRSATGNAKWIEGKAVVDLARDPLGTYSQARCDDGSSIEGNAFFGCDGAASRVRTMAFPHAQLGEVVVQEIVSTAYAPTLARGLGSTFHKFHSKDGGLAVGLLAESDHSIVWFVQFDSRRHDAPHKDGPSIARFVYERLRGWSAEVLAAISATDFDRSHIWPTRDLLPLEDIHRDNLALLGDAAHACLPFTSQGANGALEDAAALQRLLAQTKSQDELRAALPIYSALRRHQRRRLFDEGRRLRDAFLSPLGDRAPAIPLVD
jgi:2-polyprenyl-6-methoxyphenol hydroxylase-like FAD-dependent oxidoreductase